MGKGRKENKKKNIIIISLLLVLAIAVTATIVFVILHNRVPSNGAMQDEIYKVWTEANSFDDTSFMAAFETESSFVVTSVEEREEDCYVVTCDVTAPNLLDLLTQYLDGLTQRPTESKINDAIVEMISSAELQTTQQTVTAFKTDDGYVIEFTDGFIDAMYGYSYNYCCEQLENVDKSFN